MTITEQIDAAPRAFPQSEGFIIGAMMRDAETAREVFEELKSSHFYVPAAEQVFDLMVQMDSEGQPIDPASVQLRAQETGIANRVLNGGDLLMQWYLEAADYPALRPHIKAVRAAAKRRDMDAAVSRARQMLDDPTLEADDVAALLSDEIHAVATKDASLGLIDAADAAAESIAHAIAVREGAIPPGIPTGYRGLDDILGGISEGQLVLIGGRPAMGKSTVLLDIARHAALREHKNVMLVSREMMRMEVTDRLLSAETGIPLRKIKKGEIDAAEEATLNSMRRRIESVTLKIDEQSTLVNQIAMFARKMRRHGGVDLIVVDYLQLIEPTIRHRDRHVEVGEVSRALKRLAMTVAPVLAAAQVNRQAAGRTDKRPTLSDLRESGSLEQDADVVVFVHREDAYDETLREGEVDLIVAKHRNGPTGTALVYNQLDKARFVNPRL